jgi:hypothetical protein
LEILRKSYNQMVQNKDYRDEAEKRGLPVGSALTGVELQKLVAANLSTVPDDVLKEYLELTADHRGK